MDDASTDSGRLGPPRGGLRIALVVLALAATALIVVPIVMALL